MGKVSIIAAIAFSFIGYLLLQTMQESSRETEVKQADYLSSQIARELAIKGRKLVLASWLNASGGAVNTININENGGTIKMEAGDYTILGDTLDFKVRGVYNGAVHDIRSRFQYVNFGANPLQLSGPDVEMSIDNNAILENIQLITLDDHAIDELETVLIDELALGGSLSEFDLGFDVMQEQITNELAASGHGDISLTLLEQADRDLYDAQNGMFFPEQVQQAINTYLATNPGAELAVNNPYSIPENFGATGPNVLRMEGNLTVPAFTEISGQGILIVEGNLIVQDNAIFNWDGLILVAPPSDNLNPQINFIGESNINGSLVALQDAIPNSGHMDVTSFRDMGGTWATPHGVDMYQPSWPYWLFHTHDYTAKEGNSVVWQAPSAAERIHENRLFFNETLNLLNPTDNVYLEVNHPQNHGRGILTIALDGDTLKSHPVAAGFPGDKAFPGNAYRTKVFKVQQLDWLTIDITRLSSLRKMWDDSSNPFPGCTLWGGTNGAVCVGQAYNRHDALTIRMYKIGGGPPKRVFETALYWHRQEAEEESFEDEMEDLVDELTSGDFGIDISFGDSTHFRQDDAVLHALSGFGGSAPMGMHNLGTWHRHWEADDPANPLLITE